MVKPLRHSQAQRWIQARADGALDEQEITRLDAHLQTCASCQSYAAEFLKLDAGLHDHFRTRRAVHRQEYLSTQPRALDSLHHKLRSNMSHKQILTLASSLSFTILMVILGIGLSSILSMEIYPPRPGQQSTLPGSIPSQAPTETPRPTPLPWTEAAPLTDTAQIAAILSSLAQKNVAALQNGPWMHTQRQDLGETGMIQNYAIDEWTRSSSTGEACAPYLVIVKDVPEDGQVIQIQLGLPDGTSGDLTSLRKGQGEVAHYGSDDPGCLHAPETTAAGQLVPFIDQGEQPPLAKKPSKLVEAKAWYSQLNGQLAFVVSAIFEDQAEASEEYRQTYEETRHFDVQTGTLLREHIVMKWADGSPFGESLAGYQVEFLPDLPEAVSQELETYAQELMLVDALQAAEGAQQEQIRQELEQFRQSMGILPGDITQSTPNPDGSTQEISLDDLPYSQVDPLTDLTEIRAILEALQARREAKFAQPGWYLYGPAEADPQNWISSRYVLIHVLVDGCEDLIYYDKDSKILPQEIHLADGRWGFISVVDDGAFSEAGTDWQACRLENLGIDYPANEFSVIQGLQEGTVDGEVMAWVEDINGRKYFVLNYDYQYLQSQPSIMDPDTRKLEPLRRQQEWKYYDMEWGSNSGRAAMYYLENGKSFGEAPAVGVIPTYSGTPLEVHYYQELPARLAEIYAETIVRLDAYIGQTAP